MTITETNAYCIYVLVQLVHGANN